MSLWGLMLLFSLLGSAFFSASETAVVSSNRMRQRAAREQGRRLAGLAERLYRSPERTLAVLLLGNNVVNVLASVTAVLITQGLLDSWHRDLPAAGIDLIATLWIVPLVLVLGEVLPKGIGRSYADRLTRVAAPLLLPLCNLLWPLLTLLEIFSRWLGRLLSGAGEKVDDSLSWETVRLHVQAGREEGAVGHEEERLIGRIAQLNQLSARSLMRPLSELMLFPKEDRVGDLIASSREGLPVRVFLYRSDRRELDSFVASLHLLGQDPGRRLEELSSPLRRVPASRPLLDLIDELQFTHSKFAAVTDLEGRVQGVVFLRDLLERLVRLGRADTIGQ